MLLGLLIGSLIILAGAMGIKNKKFATNDYIPLSKKDVKKIVTKKIPLTSFGYYEGKPAVILGYFFVLVGIVIILLSIFKT